MNIVYICRFLLLFLVPSISAIDTDLYADEGITIVLVGDSTVSSVTGWENTNTLDSYGWGQVLGKHLNSRIKLVNRAKPGASAKSYITSGYWKSTKDINAEFILIQFGHNDQPGNGDRSTNPTIEFKMYLSKYISDSISRNIIPVLITPVVRRNYRNSRIVNSLRVYAKSIRELGKAHNLTVIDLNKQSEKMFNLVGKNGARKYANNSRDRTHFSYYGANEMAKIVLTEIKYALPDLHRKMVRP